MLDPKLIREKPQMIQDMLKARSVDFDLEGLVEVEQKRREFIVKTDDLRKKKNELALLISQRKKKGEGITSTLIEMKDISSKLYRI